MISLSAAVLAAVLLYLAISIALNSQVNITSSSVIDELFHIPQGIKYCRGVFNEYDPKITTLPGLYILTTFTCHFFSCTYECFRMTNVVLGAVNLILFYKIRTQLHPQIDTGNNLLHAINIGTLPPLLFFSQLYYTDIPSLTMVLAVLYFSNSGFNTLVLLTGVGALLMRQTNIVFIGFIAAIRLSGMLYNAMFNHAEFKRKKYAISKKDILGLPKKLKNVQQLRISIGKLPQTFFSEVATYLLLLIISVLFVHFNGGIVLGDKAAHPAQLHLPQLFYCCGFIVFFSAPHFIELLKPLKSSLTTGSSLLSFISILAIVFSNSVIHPYLLADNRHYTFYVWNRFFGSTLTRCLWSPIHFATLYLVFKKTYNDCDLRFHFFFLPTMVAVLCLQGLLEIRYFLTPYVIFKLYIVNASKHKLIVELAFHLAINLLTFVIFFNKEIHWNDFDEVQRLIW